MSNGLPNYPQTLPANTVFGRLASTPGPAEAIQFAQLAAAVAISPSGSSLVSFLQSGAGSVPRTLQDKCRDEISILDKIGLFVAGTDYYTQIVAAFTDHPGKTIYFPYVGADYKYGTNLTIPVNVNLRFDQGANLSPVASQTITWTGSAQTPGTTWIQNLHQVTNVPAAVAVNAQMQEAFFAVGGAGTNTTARVAVYGQAQTGGGGNELMEAGNFLGVQNSADAMSPINVVEINFNNNKSDDALNPTAAQSHYGIYLSTGGTKLVGPAAVYVISGGGAPTQWRRAIKVEQGAVSDFVFDYQGDGTHGFFQVTAESVTKSTNFVAAPDINFFTTTLIETALTAAEPAIKMYRAVGDNVNSRAVWMQNTNGAFDLVFGTADAVPGAETPITQMSMTKLGVMTLQGYTGAATWVTGDRYLVVNASGVVHISAVGPAS